jgi:hypothetical protein
MWARRRPTSTPALSHPAPVADTDGSGQWPVQEDREPRRLTVRGAQREGDAFPVVRASPLPLDPSTALLDGEGPHAEPPAPGVP